MRTGFDQLPDHWSLKRLDRVATVRARIGWKALTATEYVSSGVIFLSTPNIKSDVIDFDNVNYIPEWRYEESPELKLQPGDVLLAKDGNTLGITNVVTELPGPTTVNGSIAVLRPSAIDSRFLRYVLASGATQGQINAVRAGMGVPHLFQWDINRLPVPMPPALEQRAIVEFLDTETARVDSLTTKKRRMIDLARLRLLVHANDVTRTGSVLAARRILDRVKTGTTPSNDDAEMIRDDGEVEWVSPSDVGSGLRLAPAARRVDARAVQRGVLPNFPTGSVVVVGIGATAGRVAFVDRDVTANQQMTCLMPNDLMDARFLAWQLYARSDELRRTAPFTTLPILNNEFLRSLLLYVPRLDEQRERVTALDAELNRTNKLERTLLKQIALLEEHRHGLITAAVTGQLVVAA